MREIEEWMLNIFTKMKQYGIRQSDIADKLGVSRETINRALNGDNSMANAENRIQTALDEIIAEREVKTQCRDAM